MTKRLQGRIAVVTGASRGLGRAMALALAREGAHIIATARTQGGLEELDDEIQKLGGTATIAPADMKDFAAIDRLGAGIFERWKKLDIVIGNAGLLGKLTPISHADAKMFEEVMAVNVTANYRLIRSLDPLLKASDAGRAVFVTSGQAQKCFPYWGAYSISKAALEAMVSTYAQESATSNIRVNCFSPGPTRTDMRAKAMPGENPLTLPTADEVGAQVIDLCLPTFTDNAAVYKYAASGLYKQYDMLARV